MTLKTAKKRIKQLEQDVIDLQLQFENLDERFSRVDALAKASAPYIADPNTIPMGGSNIVSEPELLKSQVVSSASGRAWSVWLKGIL